MTNPRIAVLIPCLNEETTIGEVVRSFRSELPDARIYVFDNNSTDRTADRALEAGAVVHHEPRQGKGYVVQSMFRLIDADIYVMVDGDSTYPASAVHSLIAPIADGSVDMVIGSRLHPEATSSFSTINRFGNKFYLKVLEMLFGTKLTDLLSGYRAFSRRLVKSLPLFAGGFETEAELTIKTLERRFRIIEVPVNLKERPEGSSSKIRVISDGVIILTMMMTLVRDYKPLTFFSAIWFFCFLLSTIPAGMVMIDFVKRGTVIHFASAIFAVALWVLGSLALAVGLLLHTISRRFQELEYQLQTFASDRPKRQVADGNDRES